MQVRIQTLLIKIKIFYLNEKNSSYVYYRSLRNQDVVTRLRIETNKLLLKC